MRRLIRHRVMHIGLAAMVAACSAPNAEQRDSTPPMPSQAHAEASDSAPGVFELQSLNGSALPATIAWVRSGTMESCGDTTYAATYVLIRDRWMRHDVTGNDCQDPAEHVEASDSGTIERWGDSVRFRYANGGAIVGELRGDTLVVADGGPSEVYRRARTVKGLTSPSNDR